MKCCFASYPFPCIFCIKCNLAFYAEDARKRNSIRWLHFMQAYDRTYHSFFIVDGIKAIDGRPGVKRLDFLRPTVSLQALLL